MPLSPKTTNTNGPSELTRFDHFMAEALYGPRGYYTSPRPILGFRGDFTTIPKLTPILGQALAEWIVAQWKHHRQTLPVIELGPGDASLARQIHDSLGFFHRRRLAYHFVEISPHLAARQKEKLSGKKGGEGSWHPTLRQALQATEGKALILSNEFFDAFPVRIFNDCGEELYLDSHFREFWQPFTDQPDSLLFQSPPPRFEVAESIHQWFQQNLTDFKLGTMLSIDYGGDASEIFHRRPLGTLRAYAHHLRLLPPEAYQNPGHQDLTTDIHFPDLIQWGRQVGLNPISYLTQARFLNLPHDPNPSPHQAFKVLQQSPSP